MPTIPQDVVEANAELIAMVDDAVAHRGPHRGSLIPVLQDLRERHVALDGVAMQVVAERLGIPPVQVYGVVSFYSFLGTSATGRWVVRLCRSLSCEMAGAKPIAAVLEEELGVGFGETTPDGLFTLEWANCIGKCDATPAMLVGQRAHGDLTPAAVAEVIGALRAGAPE